MGGSFDILPMCGQMEWTICAAEDRRLRGQCLFWEIGLKLSMKTGISNGSRTGLPEHAYTESALDYSRTTLSCGTVK